MNMRGTAAAVREPVVKAELVELAREAERAWQAGDPVRCQRSFLRAGDVALQRQLWRSASRYLRNAIELDMVDRSVVRRLAAMGPRDPNSLDWSAYARALEQQLDWPSFSCRSARCARTTPARSSSAQGPGRYSSC
jgi:hypothetical protein